LIESLTNFFSVNIRIKIYSTKIAYTIPPKTIKLQEDFYGINYAKNRYIQHIKDINDNENFKLQAYFLVIDGPSIEKNTESYLNINNVLDGVHIGAVPASSAEISQILSEL
jgi:hypothetical protein